MKVVAFNGSPRAGGNTSLLIETALEELRKEGIEAAQFQLGGKLIHGCTGCMQCFENTDHQCVMVNDVINDCVQKMVEADGIIIGSPTYFSNVTTEVKALIDRVGMISLANGHLMKRKVGAAVVSARRAGATNTFDAINKFFMCNQMIIPGSVYWNLGLGLNPGDVKDDEEGIQTMEILGQNMAWLLKKIND
jgi:multimeric flavodoxin WrbA